MDRTFVCPHCDGVVLVPKGQLNCKIFRHGVYKKNNKQIDPHLNKEECDRLFKEGLIYGCGKPFKLLMDEEENKFWTEKCNYI